MVKEILIIVGIILISMIVPSITSTAIHLQECQMKGDLNCDTLVNDFELLDYIEIWAMDEVSDFDLLGAIDNWVDSPITDENLSVWGDGNSKVTVVRDMPYTVIPEVPFNISLIVDVNESNKPNGVIVEEYVPVGWSVSCSSNWFRDFNSETGRIRFLGYGRVAGIELVRDQTISYKVTAPANVTGTANFTGVVRIKNSSNFILGDLSVKIAGKVTITANRTLPEKANAGSRVNVTIALDVNESSKPNSVIVKDYFPAGWNVTGSEPSANSVNSTMGEIKWILFGESVSDRIISYTLGIPPGVLGNNTFSGEFMYLDQWNSTITGDITGDSVISVNFEKECLVKGDANCDDAVSDFEILAYVNKWANGEVSDFDLLEAINNWAKG